MSRGSNTRLLIALITGIAMLFGAAALASPPATGASNPTPPTMTSSTHVTFDNSKDAAGKKAKHGKKAHKGKNEKVSKRIRACKNPLARTLYKAGFRGKDLREAWAIAMRESHGHETSVSSTNDYGLFQLNRATFASQKWWSGSRLLDADYNAKVAYRLSRGGKTWYPWGLDGKGNVNAHVYRSAGWSQEQINNWIVEPYERYHRQYPC